MGTPTCQCCSCRLLKAHLNSLPLLVKRYVWQVLWGRGSFCPGPGRGGVGMSLPPVSSRMLGHIVLFSLGSQTAASWSVSGVLQASESHHH